MELEQLRQNSVIEERGNDIRIPLTSLLPVIVDSALTIYRALGFSPEAGFIGRPITDYAKFVIDFKDPLDHIFEVYKLTASLNALHEDDHQILSLLYTIYAKASEQFGKDIKNAIEFTEKAFIVSRWLEKTCELNQLSTDRIKVFQENLQKKISSMSN